MANPAGQHTARRPKGHIIITPEFGPQIEFDTLQCVHCGRHWEVVPGSGRKRGWCLKCNGPTCGAQKCDECYPFEKQIEDAEKRGV